MFGRFQKANRSMTMAACIRHCTTLLASTGRSTVLSASLSITKINRAKLLVFPLFRCTATSPNIAVKQKAYKFRYGKRTSWWVLTGPSLALLGFGSKGEKKTEQEDDKELTEDEKQELKCQEMVNHLYNKAVEAMDRKKYVAADKIFHEALELSTTFMKEGKITKKNHLSHVAYLLSQMGNNALSIHNHKGAEKLFKDSIAVALELGMEPNDNAIIEMSLKIADIYGFLREDDLAMAGYRFCIQEQASKVNENPNIDENSRALLGMAYQSYGRFLSYKRKFPESKKAFTKAFEISKMLHGPGQNEPLAVMLDIANVMILLEEYEEAEALFLDGIEQGKKINAEILSALYTNLGALYLRMSKIPEAEKACNDGMTRGKQHKDELFVNMADDCLQKILEIKMKENMVKSG